jgi:hypothetical protein
MLQQKRQALGTLLAAASVATLGLLSPAGARASSYGGSVDIQASVTIKTPFAISSGTPLVFGDATMVDSASGTITMPTDSNSVISSTNITMDPNIAARGSFYFISPEPATYQIKYPSRVQMTNLANPSKTINLAPAVSIMTPTTTTPNETVDIYVGGTITLADHTPTGGYVGIIHINVANI